MGPPGPASIPWTSHGGPHKPTDETSMGLFLSCLQIPVSFHPFPLLLPQLLVKTNLRRKGTSPARPSCERRSERHLRPDSKIKIKMNLKPRWLLARGGGSVYGPICRRFNRMGPALWQGPPVPLPSIWGPGSDLKLFPAVPLFALRFAPGPGQAGRKGGDGDATGTCGHRSLEATTSSCRCAAEVAEPAWGCLCGSWEQRSLSRLPGWVKDQ